MADYGRIDTGEIEAPQPDDTATSECDNCRYEALLTYYWHNPREKPHWYCEVCASTPLARATSYPGQVDDPALYRSIAWGLNRILDEIRRTNPMPGS